MRQSREGLRRGKQAVACSARHAAMTATALGRNGHEAWSGEPANPRLRGGPFGKSLSRSSALPALLMAALLLVGCGPQETPEQRQARYLTKYTYETRLSDGTRCAVYKPGGISCNWTCLDTERVSE